MTLKVDLSSEFLVPASSPPLVITITTTPSTISPNVREVLVNVASAAVLTLPDAASWALLNPGADLLIKDVSGNAFVNTITVNRAGSNTIDGTTSVTISQNWGVLALRVSPTNNWLAVEAPASSPLPSVTITTTPATITSNVQVVLVSVASAAVLTLPSAAAWALLNPGAELLIKDISGNASTNNITINRAGANTIDGRTSLTIGLDWGAFALRVSPANNWMVVEFLDFSSPLIVTFTTTPQTIAVNVQEVLVNVASAAVLTLPSAAAWALLNPGADLLIKDISGNASTNNITINRAGANTIDGQTSIKIAGDWGVVALRVSPSNNWLVVEGPGLSSSFIQAGTGAVQRATQDKMRETRISVKDFGAVGDGSAIDTTAIQNAINAFQGTGATIFFPRGSYKVDATLSVTGTIRFEGESRTGATIQWTSTTLNVFSVNTNSQVFFEKFTFLGPAAATAGSIIILDGPSGTGNGFSYLRDCTFTQGCNHLVTGSASDWTIDNCFFNQYVGIGCYVSNTLHHDAGDSVICNSTFVTSQPNAVAIHQVSSGGLKIVGNKFIGGKYGYRMVLEAGGTSTVDLMIGNNSIEGHISASISFERPTGIKTFGGITITGNQLSGISVNATSSWSCIQTDSNAGWLGRMAIVGNHILMPQAGAGGLIFVGILMGSAADGFVISGNQFSAESPLSTSVGIQIDSGAVNGVIGANQFNVLAGSGGSWANKLINNSTTTYVNYFAPQSGTISVTCSTADGALWVGTAAVTFAVAYDIAPKVTCTPGNVTAGVAAVPVSITKTGFTLTCHSGVNGGAGTATWDALGVL